MLPGEQEEEVLMRHILAGAAVLALVFPEVSQAQANVVDRLAPGQPPVVISHLGNNGGFLEGGYPENSLASIQYAIELGVDGVYLPIQVTQDSRYVVMHDATLNATTNVEEIFPDGPPGRSSPMTGKRMDFVSDYTLAEIRQLHLTDGQDGAEERVPSLEEVLALIDGRVLAILSLKTYDLVSLTELLATQDTENLLVVSTTDAREVLEVSQATGVKAEVDLGACCRKDPVAGLEALAKKLGPDLVMAGADKSLPSAELIEKAAELEIRLSVYPSSEDYYLTRGDSGPWETVLEGGATAFLTDHPSAILELMGR